MPRPSVLLHAPLIGGQSVPLQRKHALLPPQMPHRSTCACMRHSRGAYWHPSGKWCEGWKKGPHVSHTRSPPKKWLDQDLYVSYVESSVSSCT